MPSSKDKPSSDGRNTTAPRPGGVDRRSESAKQDKKPQTSSGVRFDEKGNPVFEIRANVPRRREDDNTIDLLKCLDDESLALADDDDN